MAGQFQLGDLTGLSGRYPWAMTNYKQGDAFQIEDLNTGVDECPAVMAGGLPFCNLARDHGGQHVAADAELRVVAVWP